MKLIKIYNKFFGTIIFAILAIQLNAQILNNVGNRNAPNIHETNVDEEYSGLAFHPCHNLFFMPVDDPINYNNSFINIVGYDLNVAGNGTFYPAISNNIGDIDLNIEAENNTNTYGCAEDYEECNKPDDRNDLEGLTYLEQDYFVMVEERTNYIYFLEYQHSEDINNRAFKIISRHNTEIGLSQPKDGLEGISYDRYNKRLFLVQEVNPPTLYCLPITLPGNGSLGSINVNQKSSIVLTNHLNLVDAAGLFHISQIVSADNELSDNLLILSQESTKIFEVKITLNLNNTISINSLGEKSINSEIKPEGITVYNNQIYIASERGVNSNDVASLSSYTLPNNFALCNNLNENCVCVGCTDACATNYDPNAVEDDGTCNPYNDTCNTDCSNGPFNGIWNDASCFCINEVIPVNGCTNPMACNFNSLANCDDDSCQLIGAPCQDGVINDNCECITGDCPEELELSSISPTDIFEVSKTIQSTAIINNNQNVQYDAGGSICLDNGFLANSKEGAVVFLAKIGGCTQLRKANSIKQITSIKNFPNPFTGKTTIEFELEQQAEVSLLVTDITGKIVSTMLFNQTKNTGKHQLQFDGSKLSAGIYYCTIQVGNHIETQKMLITK